MVSEKRAEISYENAQFALEPLAPKDGWPLNYAYLIKTSAPLADIYPIMGELLFSCYRYSKKNKGSPIKEPPNVIYVAIDDDMDLLLWNLLKSIGETGNEVGETRENTEGIIPYLGDSYVQFAKRLFFIDTFGEFGKDRSVFAEHKLCRNSFLYTGKIAGSGNPMKIYRFIDKAAGSIAKEIRDWRLEGQQGVVRHSSWTVYLLNSLSSMYRNLGLGETVALLRMVLKKMWEISNKENDGILFAIVQDNVMNKEEQSYIESFFDGIINIENKKMLANGNSAIMIPSIRIEKSLGARRIKRQHLFLPKSPDAQVGRFGGGWKEAVFTKYAPLPVRA